jgi:hypothetical protein
MIHGRTLALALAALFATGCASGSSVAPPAPQQQVQSAAQYAAESSAARFILANAGRNAIARSPQGWSGGGDDDGDRGELQLPQLASCGAGTFATDCSVWAFSPGHSTRAGARSAQSVASTSPPVLNFCRDGGAFPADLGAPATPSQLLFATYSFGLSYTGTKATPIVTFVTRSSNVSLTGTFAGNATSASLLLTPVLTTAASRGWLVFFTWSWPADILLVPYEINEIQLAASSDPLVIPAGGSAALGAFDCLGRKITARAFGSGFGFNHNLSGATVTSPANELNVPVFGGARPTGFISLGDDRGAQVIVPVTH